MLAVCTTPKLATSLPRIRNRLPAQVYVDATLGAGGHMKAMIQQHPVSAVL